MKIERLAIKALAEKIARHLCEDGPRIASYASFFQRAEQFRTDKDFPMHTISFQEIVRRIECHLVVENEYDE